MFNAPLYHLSDGDVEALLEKASPENTSQYSGIEPSGDSPKPKCAGETDFRIFKYKCIAINTFSVRCVNTSVGFFDRILRRVARDTVRSACCGTEAALARLCHR